MATQPQFIDEDFELLGEGALDSRNRIPLTKAVEALHKQFGDVLPPNLRFTIYQNKAGQVLLSPATSVPLHEAWLFKNHAALASVHRGLTQSAEGELHDRGSFTKYADDDIE
jgi:hypothetical protein